MPLDPVIEFVLEREGGFEDSAADRGGRTNFGITKPFLTDFFRRTRGKDHPEATDADIDALTLASARDVYGEYIAWTRIGGIENANLRLSVFDVAVNSHHTVAFKMLQRGLIAMGFKGLVDDGVYGPRTREALLGIVGDLGARAAIYVQTARVRFYTKVAKKQLDDRDKNGIPDGLQFLEGWHDRALDLIEKFS